MFTLREDQPTPPDHVGMNAASALGIALGWGGLYLLITTQNPYVGQRWAFFVLLFIAVTASLIPFVRTLHARFTPAARELPPAGVIVRQCVWGGVFVVACAWLQMPRVLSAPIAFFLALALVVIEVFLRVREMPSELRDLDETDA